MAIHVKIGNNCQKTKEKKMICKKCGKEIDSETKYCIHCGNKNIIDSDVLSNNFNNIKQNFKNLKIKLTKSDFIKNESNTSKPQIVYNLIFLAIAFILIGVAIKFFVLSHETLYTYNGIPKSEAPKQSFIGWISLISGIIIAIVDILNMYNKK